MSTIADDGGDFGGGPRFALPAMMPATKSLLWITSILGVLCLLFGTTSVGAPVFKVLALAPRQWHDWFPWLPLWQLATYGFLHSTSDPMHVLFNMFGLYFFGTWLEGIVGSRRFIVLYFASIMLGGAVQMCALLVMGQWVPTVGASGAIMFLLVAMATLRPHSVVLVIFIPMKLRTLALIYVGLNVFMLIREFQGGDSGVALFVHLTGAAYGFIAVKARWIWLDPVSSWQERRAQKVVEDAEQDEQRLDRLLQQIHDRGIGSLSGREREFLKRMSSRKSG